MCAVFLVFRVLLSTVSSCVLFSFIFRVFLSYRHVRCFLCFSRTFINHIVMCAVFLYFLVFSSTVLLCVLFSLLLCRLHATCGEKDAVENGPFK